MLWQKAGRYRAFTETRWALVIISLIYGGFLAGCGSAPNEMLATTTKGGALPVEDGAAVEPFVSTGQLHLALMPSGAVFGEIAQARQVTR